MKLTIIIGNATVVKLLVWACQPYSFRYRRLLGGLLYYKISRGKVSPLIGIAGVFCMSTTAEVVQKVVFQANKWAMVLPYAMGPNVAGVITTAIICGIHVTAIPLLS